MKCPICGSTLKLKSIGKGLKERWMLTCQDFLKFEGNESPEKVELHRCHYHTQWFDTIQKAINHHFEIIDFIVNKKNPDKKGWFK